MTGRQPAPFAIEQDDMTDDATRRKIFWLLQRLTSLSLWTRKREAFERFANAYEHAVNTWPDGDPRPSSAPTFRSSPTFSRLTIEG